MPGKILAGTSIAVDYFFKDHGKTYFRFLTHVHSDCISGLTASFEEYIHTSPFNAWVLKTQIKVDPKYIIQLSVGESHVIFDRSMDKNFSVTLIDSNHCPGSVMFLFQGSFGNILYTGHFRYNPVMFKNQMLRSIVDNECLDYLYLDNTYAAEHCKFPSKKKALENILNLVRARPRHQILVGLHKLGKEEVLEAIAVDVNELIHVSQQRLDVLNQLKFKKVFTTDKRLCRIFAVEMHAIDTYKVIRSQINEGPILTLVLTGVYFAAPPEAVSPYAKSGKYGIYVQPYSDHSSHDELFEFVSFLKPNVIIPIIEQNIQEPIDLFWSHLWKNSVIPKRILDLAKNSSSLSPINEMFSFSPPDGSHVPNEIIAENYQEMKCKNLISDSVTAPNKIVVKVSDNILKSIKNSSNELTDIHLSNNCLNDLNNTKSSSSSSPIISECCEISTKNNAYKDTNREKESSHEHIKSINKTENCNIDQFNNENGNDTEICKDVWRTLVSTENSFTYQLNSKSKDVSTNTDVDCCNTIVKQQNNESLHKSNTFQCNNYESKLNATNYCNKGQNNCEFKYETIDKANFKVSIVVVGSVQDSTPHYVNETVQGLQRKENDNNDFCEREGQLCSGIKETYNDINMSLVNSSHTNDNQIVTYKQKQEKCSNNKENVIDYHSVACTQISLHNNDSKHILCQQKQDNCQEEIDIFSSFSNNDSVGGSQNSATENEIVLHKQIQEGCSEKKEKYNDKNESVESSRKSEANYKNVLHEQIHEKSNDNKEKYIDKYESVASSQSSELDCENVLHEQIHEKSNENKEKYIDKYKSVASSQSREVDYENVSHEQIHEKSNENKEKYIDKYKSVASSQSSEVYYENVSHEQIHKKSNENKEKYIDKYKSVASSQSREVDYENVSHEQIHEKSNENKEKYIDKYKSVASSQSSEVDYENVLHKQIHEKSNKNKEKYIDKYKSVASSESSEEDYENVLHKQIHEKSNKNKEKYIDNYKLVASSQSSEVDYENDVLHEPIHEKSNKNKEKYIDNYKLVASSQSSEVDYENDVLHEPIHEKSNENKEKYIDKYKSVASSESSEEDYENVLHKQIHEKSNENKEKYIDKYKSVASSESSEEDYENVLHKQIHEKSNKNKEKYIDKYKSVASSQSREVDYENVSHEQIHEKYNDNKEKYIDKYESVASSQSSEVDYENVLHKPIHEKSNKNKEKYIDKYKSVASSQSSEVDYENVLHEPIHEKSNKNKEKYIDKYKSVASSQSSEEDYEQTHEKCMFSDYNNSHHIERLQNSTTDNENQNFVCEQKEETYNNDKKKYSSHSKYQLVDNSQNSIVDNENKKVLYELNQETFYNNKNHNVSISSYQKSVNVNKTQNISYEGNITYDKNRRNYDLRKKKPIDRSYKNRTYNGNKNVIIEEFQPLNNFIEKDIDFCKRQLTDTKKSIKSINEIQNEVCKSNDGIFVDISESQNEMQVDILKSTAFVENCRLKSSSVDKLIKNSHNTSLRVKQNCLSSLSNKSLQINHDYNQQLFFKDITSGFFVYKSENQKFHNANHCDNTFEDSSSVISGSYNHLNTSDCINQKMSPPIYCPSTNSDCTINCFSDSNDSSKLQTGIVSRNKRKMSMELVKNECYNGLKNNFIPLGYKRRKIKNLNHKRKLEFWNHLNCKKIFALPCFQKK